jgi:protein-S-isoprenylcysteine O-methyltransferase Ste14
MDHVVLAALWITWCTIHSAMISIPVTEYLKRRLGKGFRFYRLVFNGVAFFTLMPVVVYGHSIKGAAAYQWEGFARWIQMLLLALSAGLFFAGARQYDMLQFLGFRQIKTETACISLNEICELNTTGVLEITRHPWYLASIILLWTFQRSVDASALISNSILTVYLMVGTVIEEQKLLAEYGQTYRKYQQKVSMLFPFKYLKSKIRGFYS